MHRLWLIVLVALTLAAAPIARAQTQAPPAPKQQSKPAAEPDSEEEEENEAAPPNTNLPANTPVITIKGLCDAPKPSTAAAKSDCKTVITRSEFERLANTLQPGMPPQVRKQLANAYPRLLVMAKEAQRRGIEKDPHYVESVKFAKLQLLNQELNKRMQEDAARIPEKDLQDYYDKNTKSYEAAALQRVFVPRVKQIEGPKEGTTPEQQQNQEKGSEDAMKKVAEDLRTRAVAGEDFDKLQKEAYEAAGIKANPPATSIPKIRRVNLPPAHAAIFDLKPGEVSQVINDAGGHYFYKMQSKSVPPLDEVKQEIHSTLQSQRMREEVQKLQDSVTSDLNEAYFGGGAPGPSGEAQPKPTGSPAKPAAAAVDK